MIEHVNKECRCQGKVCTNCKEPLCVGMYWKRNAARSGLEARCKKCLAQHNKEWWQANGNEYGQNRKEKRKEFDVRYRQKNKEKAKESQEKYQQGNKEKIKKIQATYRQKNREKLKEKAARRRQDNPQKVRESERKWKRSHPVEAKAYKRNREKYNIARQIYRTMRTQAGGSYTVQEWRDLKAKYNNMCLRCGRSDVKLAADHIIPVSKGGHSNIDNIQPLCVSCNSWKKDKAIDFRPQNT